MTQCTSRYSCAFCAFLRQISSNFLDSRAASSTTAQNDIRSPLHTMTDPRCTKLAKLLVEYSTGLKRGDHILLDLIDVPDEFGIELIRAARAAGATPIVAVRRTRLTRELLRGSDERHARLERELELFRMKKVQAYIAIRGSGNANENA